MPFKCANHFFHYSRREDGLGWAGGGGLRNLLEESREHIQILYSPSVHIG